MVQHDILDRLRMDPGHRTLGQLLQDREAAIHEIATLRAQIERLRATWKSDVAAAPGAANPRQAEWRPGTLLRLGDVCDLLGVARSTVYRWMSRGEFPAPVRIGDHAVRWSIESVQTWRDAL
jgi:prophage regulatory protein